MGHPRTDGDAAPRVPWSRWAVVALVLAFGVSSLAPARLLAQVADAAIEVLVRDQSQGLVPGATVTATRPDTGRQQVVVTAEHGLARILALPPGTYVLRVELQGFATVEQSGITLRVGQVLRLGVTMRPAGVSEQVDVRAEAPLVDVFKTDSSINVVPEQIESLPVPNREFQSLAFLAPTVQRERGTYRFIYGAPVLGSTDNASGATILVDGVDLTDPLLGLSRVQYSQDAVSEFRVITNRFDAEIGGSSGGALSVVTKSGTNDLRGSVFAFFRDDSLRLKTTEEKNSGMSKAPYSRQQFGFTLGGPIVENRTHFFGAFEQANIHEVARFRPGPPYTSLATDYPMPVRISLPFVALDHRFTSTQNLRATFVYERNHWRNWRVGGPADESAGMTLHRQNWNLTTTHSWTIGSTSLNQLSAQAGRRAFDEPANSQALLEVFGNGNTLVIGTNAAAEQDNTGDVVEIRDTFFVRVGRGRWAQDLKFGGAWQHVTDDWFYPVYPRDQMLYFSVDRSVPFVYTYAEGVGHSTVRTNLISGFLQTELKPSPRAAVSLGVRYDLDTAGTNRDYTSPLVPTPRGRDTDNVQPRAGFSWDLTGAGRHVVRGGIGYFTGRLLLVPAHIELQQNGFTGRIIRQRLNGQVLGLPPAFWLQVTDPRHTGIALPPSAAGYDNEIVSPHATQLTGGYTARLGNSGLYADVEAIFVKGDDELVIRDTNWPGNDDPACAVSAARCRPNSSFSQINLYASEGRSEYKALVVGVNGLLWGRHTVSASWTLADKKSISDDFSPALNAYPSDPADLEAEWGRSRADERHRVVASAVLQVPARFTVAPVFYYGSGQPWNRLRGYDYNGDGSGADRLPGVAKYDQDGPSYCSVDLRITYRLPFGPRAGLDLIAEAFNLFNRTNWVVESARNGEALSGPTLQNPALPLVPNPLYGQYGVTLRPREFQLAFRLVF